MESLVQFCAAYVSQMDRKSHTAKLRKEKKEAKYPRNQLRRQNNSKQGKTYESNIQTHILMHCKSLKQWLTINMKGMKN